ncbi:MAG: BatD family protein [Gammaproteobacteria bacterium]|nr:BatD family protein [Gammaproteobacteria bacterium]
MVRLSRRSSAWIAVMTLLVGVEAGAAVVTRVDRADIELNESFTLEVITDENTDLQPDISVLEADFYIGQGSQLSNTTIVNGQIRRSKTWTYVLMPRRAGDITIPPIAVGNQQSTPLTITVSEPTYAPPGEAEVFLTSEVDFDETYVQAQVLLSIRIYRSVATRQPALRDPTVSGVEVLSELAGDDRSYEAVIDGTPYNVVERVYALYPQESGAIKISSARFEARVLRNGRITGRKVFESEPLSVNVLPIPDRPADFPDATWLPAKDLQLSEDWSRDADQVKAGEPLTRRVSISALGQLETQIPALEPPTTPGINVYPDKPELSRNVEAGGIRGVRSDQYAMIGVTPGDVVLPALEIPWWNTGTAQWELATLPERTLTILPSGEAAPPLPEPESAPSTEDAAAESGDSRPAMPPTFWRRVSELLAAVWLVTLLSWWWSSRPVRRESREPAPVPLHKQQSRLLKEARKAARAGQSDGVRQALLQWAAIEWPDDAPRSLGAMADRVSADLADELRRFSKLTYGPQPGEFDGEALARAIRSFSTLKADDSSNDESLPPLMPAS